VIDFALPGPSSRCFFSVATRPTRVLYAGSIFDTFCFRAGRELTLLRVGDFSIWTPPEYASRDWQPTPREVQNSEPGQHLKNNVKWTNQK
jgi:hypothetical protein